VTGYGQVLWGGTHSAERRFVAVWLFGKFSRDAAVSAYRQDFATSSVV
jgi:hypothetical protein